MKRYILIDIPCALLVLISILMFLYSVDGYYRFADVEKSLVMLKPAMGPDALIEYIDNLGRNDEYLEMIAKVLKSNHHEIMMKSDFEIEIIGSLKNRYQLLIYISGLFVGLTLFLSIGLARHFRKSSNHTMKVDEN